MSERPSILPWLAAAVIGTGLAVFLVLLYTGAILPGEEAAPAPAAAQEFVPGLKRDPGTWQEQTLPVLAGELRQPDVTIDATGRYMLVGGKATNLVTAIDFQRVLRAIEEKRFEGEEFGIPILETDFVRAATMDLGLGPTYIEFDDKGYAYVGFFVDSAIKKVPLGEPYTELHGQEPWKVAEVIPVHYSVGHLMVAGGDMAKPYDKYLISMNKLAKDIFLPQGPLIAENHELFDISGNPTRLIDQAPFPPETHYAQAIPVGMINPITVYQLPEQVDEPGVEYDYANQVVRVYMTAVRSWFTPSSFTVPQGWTVKMRITNIEQAMDITHGIAMEGHDISLSLDPGETREVEFLADKPGVYWYYCIWFCSELHLEMRGRMIVIPQDEWGPEKEWQPPEA